MTSEPANTHVNRQWLNRRSRIEIIEAEFNLLTQPEQVRYFGRFAASLPSEEEKTIATSILESGQVHRGPLFERLRKMFLHYAYPEVIAEFRREIRKRPGDE